MIAGRQKGIIDDKGLKILLDGVTGRRKANKGDIVPKETLDSRCAFFRAGTNARPRLGCSGQLGR
jgi:hypothetical protein